MFNQYLLNELIISDGNEMCGRNEAHPMPDILGVFFPLNRRIIVEIVFGLISEWSKRPQDLSASQREDLGKAK